jgi:hypothetical protein
MGALDMGKGLKDIRDNLTPEVDAVIEDMIEDDMYHYDDINKPEHYNQGDIETIDYIEDVLGPYHACMYCHGNILKYTGHRLWTKGDPIKNMEKTIWYANRWIKNAKKCEGVNW